MTTFIAFAVASGILAVALVALNVQAYRIVAKKRTEQRNRALASGKAADAEDAAKKRKSGLADRLERAGLDVSPALYATIVGVIAASLGAIGFQRLGIVTSAALALAVVVASRILLDRRAKSRSGNFEEQLAQSLPMVADGLKSGMTFEQSLRNVAETMGEPMRGQVRQFASERMYGTPLVPALENLADRVHCADMDDLVTAVSVQAQTGGKMSEIIDSIADSMKRKKEIRRHIAIVTADGRLSEKILAALPVLLLAVISFMTPDYTEMLFKTPTGWAMLGVSAAMIIVGLLIIRKLYDVKFD